MVLEDKPLDVRKKIALRITIVVGAILIGILFAIYLSGANEEQLEKKDSAFLRFYATILDNAQSFFSPNRAIIKQ